MAYSKGDFAKYLGISRDELERRARDAGFKHTEDFYNATSGTGKMPKTPEQLAAEEKKVTDEFLGRYTGAISEQPTMQDIWGRLRGEYGLDTSRENYLSLAENTESINKAYKNVPDQIANEARGFDVNATQQARLEQQRQGEVGEQLTNMAGEAESAGRRFNLLTQDAMNELSFEMAQQEKELQPYGIEASMLSDRLAREHANYTMNQQNALTVMLTKLANQQAMDMAELGQLNKLALNEQLYQQSKDYLDYQQKYKTTGSGYTQDVFNTNTPTPSIANFDSQAENFTYNTPTTISGSTSNLYDWNIGGTIPSGATPSGGY